MDVSGKEGRGWMRCADGLVVACAWPYGLTIAMSACRSGRGACVFIAGDAPMGCIHGRGESDTRQLMRPRDRWAGDMRSPVCASDGKGQYRRCRNATARGGVRGGIPSVPRGSHPFWGQSDRASHHHAKRSEGSAQRACGVAGCSHTISTLRSCLESMLI